MTKAFIRRFALFILQLFILSLFIFVMTHIMAFARSPYTDRIGVSVREFYIIPILQMYWNWLTTLLSTGDMGRSWLTNIPVLEHISHALPTTLRLTALSMFWIYLLGIPIGKMSGIKDGSLLERITAGLMQILASIPIFAFAFLLLLFFSFGLQWLPSSGSLPPGMQRANVSLLTYQWTRIQHLILPSLSIALVYIIIPVKYLKTKIVETKHQEFVQCAKAKGNSDRILYKKHISRFAFITLLGNLSTQISVVLAGTLIIEGIFSISGLGNMFFNSFFWGDMGMVNALILIYAFIVLSAAFIAEIAILYLDPRISLD